MTCLQPKFKKKATFGHFLPAYTAALDAVMESDDSKKEESDMEDTDTAEEEEEEVLLSQFSSESSDVSSDSGDGELSGRPPTL